MDQKTNEYRKAIADAFVKSLQENSLEWKKGWNSSVATPQNAITGKNYKGLNRFFLTLHSMSHNITDPRWATFKQIQDKGWRLNKGAKGMKVEYWTPYDYQNKKILEWAEYNKLLEDPERRKQIGVVAKYYHVFNGQDITGIPKLPEQPERVEAVSDQIIDTISHNMGVEITNGGGNQAYYSIQQDKIFLPPKTAFISDYEYNSTALHELSHATGAANRLNRDMKNRFGTEKYAYEELVAEISSCYMGEHLQVPQTAEHMENHKAYVQSWIKAITEKPTVLMRAIKDAESSANYLEYQAELISEREYQKALSDTREVEPDEVTPKNDEKESLTDKEVSNPEKVGQQKIITQELYESMMSDSITSVGQDFTNCMFRDVKFNWFRPQMPYTDQPVVDVVGFHGADFTGSCFVNCDFSSVQFHNSSFEKCRINDCVLNRNHIDHCNFSHAYISGTRMNDIGMINSNLYKATISNTDISNSQLINNNFFWTTIHGDPNLKACFAVRNRHVNKINYSFWVWKQHADPVLGVQDQEQVSGVSNARQKEFYEDFHNRAQWTNLTEKELQLVESWRNRWNAYTFGTEALRKREHIIAEDIRSAGWRPTNGLVDHMMRLEQIAGKAYTLKNVCDLCKKPHYLRLEDIRNKYISKSDEELFHKTLDGIAQECKGQELARMRALQAAPAM